MDHFTTYERKLGNIEIQIDIFKMNNPFSRVQNDPSESYCTLENELAV